MGWNRPSENGRARSPSAPRRAGTARPTIAVRGAIAGAVVVLGAAVAAWWLWPTGETRQDAASTKRGLITEVTPAVVRTNEVRSAASPTNDPNAFPDLPLKGLVKSEKLPDGTVLRTWADGRKSILVNPMTKEELEAKLANRRYENPVDWVLAGIVHPDWEDMPLPEKISDEQIRAWLDVPVRINLDKDDEQALDEKAAVIELRRDLLAYLDSGGQAADYFREIKRRQASESIKLQESRRVVLEAFRSGDYGLTKQLLDKLNTRMREQGLPSVRFGKRFHEILEERTK